MSNSYPYPFLVPQKQRPQLRVPLEVSSVLDMCFSSVRTRLSCKNAITSDWSTSSRVWNVSFLGPQKKKDRNGGMEWGWKEKGWWFVLQGEKWKQRNPHNIYGSASVHHFNVDVGGGNDQYDRGALEDLPPLIWFFGYRKMMTLRYMHTHHIVVLVLKMFFPVNVLMLKYATFWGR